ncbi:hypothetical protein D6C84_09833 [Aureobasidium pullulans]|uniref:Uncharacterized protein n=1 Tax=Aureobasidium pullulans TaxID=5580 RepID=A0A4S9X2K9_AURPU|nr:hypothetical protein D6C84_09833 [Aureobasidium pullulans]
MGNSGLTIRCDLKKVYALCIEHEPNEPMPDKHTVAQRYLAQVNNIISVGEALVQTDHVSESGINYLRKALDLVYDALQDNAMLRRSKKQKTESGAKATKNDGYTEDEESEVEEESIETTKRKFRSDTKCLLEKTTELLLLIWSGQGLDNVQSLAHQTRENAATIQSTLALNVVGKERTTSDFTDMASAITRMLQIRTAVVLSQIDSIAELGLDG